MATQTVYDMTQLLNIVNGPLEPEQTLDALMTLASNKNNVEAVRKLDRENVAKLVDVFDQVCRGRLQDSLICLTTAAMTRSSDPSIRRGHKTRRRYGHSALSVAPRHSSRTQQFYPTD